MVTRQPRKTSSRANDRWLSRDDWMLAGQELLCKEGIAGMRLSKLTKKLKVSTGSFYHHFADVDSYLGELADYYNSDRVERMLARIVEQTDDPLEQIQMLRAQSTSSRLFELDVAMRVWSASDRRAAAAMRRSEQVVISFLGRAFSRLGFDADESDVRARILLSVNVVEFNFTQGKDPTHFRDATLRLLMGDKIATAKEAASDEPVKKRRRAPAKSKSQE